MNELAGIEPIQLCFITAVRYSRLRRPPGQTYVDVAAKVLGISTAEVRRLAPYGTRDMPSFRLGYRMGGSALRQRGSLESLPDFNTLLRELDVDEMFEWYSKNNVDVLGSWLRDMQRNKVLRGLDS